MRKIDYYNLTFLGITVVLSYIGNKKAPRYLCLMPYLLIVSFLLELLADTLMGYYTNNNLFLYHFCEPLQYIGFSSLFYFYFSNKILKKTILYSNFIVIICAVAFALTIQPITVNNSYVNVIKNCFLLAWVIMFYRDLLLSENVVNLLRMPLYIISCGLFIYISGKLTIDFSLNLIRKSKWADIIYSNSLFLDIFLWFSILITYLQIIFSQPKHVK